MGYASRGSRGERIVGDMGNMYGVRSTDLRLVDAVLDWENSLDGPDLISLVSDWFVFPAPNTGSRPFSPADDKEKRFLS